MAAIQLDEIRSFIRVAELSSFAEAARSLGRSPSAISKQVRQLEERLGVRLVHRTTRRVSLTEPGRLYLDRTRALLEELEELEATVRGLQSEPRGTLRVTTPHDFSRLFLCEVISDFATRFPELRVEFDETDRIVDLVAEGFDVALRLARARDSTLLMRRLARCARVLCASPEYLERYGRPESPADLSAHNCIEYGYLLDEGWRFDVGGKRQTIVPTGRLRSNSGWAMRSMVLADLGIALLPRFLVEQDLAEGRVESLLEDLLDAELDINALMPPGRQIPAKTRAFLDFVSERMRAEDWWRAPESGAD